MGLENYRARRRFDKTPEPSGKEPVKRLGTGKPRFVVQKHRASQLHYDFRLEWKGVLRSWAIPKGPSIDPSVKRLATPTEDHPLEYAGFEGVIPAGEYGGGTVMVWDTGRWEPEVEDVDEALSGGELKFRLLGKKLKGSWVLVRTRGFAGSKKPSWLLIKHRDARAGEENITDSAFRSALTKRTLAQIAEDEGGDVEAAAEGDPAPARRKARAGASS